MPKLFAFLRAINVGGHTVKMDHLRHLFESIGLYSVETFIASGNVVFEADETDLQALERTIERHLAAALGYQVATFIRTEAELPPIAAFQPFAPADLEQAVAYNIGFLHDPLNEATTHKLMALKTESDDFCAHGREVYWLCRQKQSESTFSNAVLEKTIGQPSTLRGMNTVRKMVERWG